MGKTIKRRNVKRRKTRRRNLKGGRPSKVALYVWKNPDDTTFQKRVFVEDDGMDYIDSITDAGYNLRWLAGEGGNTIPRKPAGIDKYQDIKPYVKYMTADYAEGNSNVNMSGEDLNRGQSGSDIEKNKKLAIAFGYIDRSLLIKSLLASRVKNLETISKQFNIEFQNANQASTEIADYILDTK
jgi:hypothetical protein